MQDDEGKDHDPQDDPGIEGKHDAEGEQQEADQLGHAGQVEDEVVSLDIIEQFSFHGVPPLHGR